MGISILIPLGKFFFIKHRKDEDLISVPRLTLKQSYLKRNNPLNRSRCQVCVWRILRQTNVFHQPLSSSLFLRPLDQRSRFAFLEPLTLK